MPVLIAGLVIFFGFHALPMFPALRARLQGVLGERAYRLVHAAGSALALALIIYGFAAYRARDWVQLWSPPTGLRHLTLLLMLPVFVLLAAAYMPGKIKAIAKFPVLLAVKLWALAHLLANGDLGGVLMFASFLAWAVIARISAKRRAVPVPAVAGFGRNDAIALIAGLLVYGLFLTTLHPLLIGVRVLT